MLNWLLIVVIAIGLANAVAGLVILIRERRLARLSEPCGAGLPPVTILKPLKGLDGNLENNLRTFFELDYPEYEIVFAVRDLDDPAIAVVRKLRRENPGVDARLVIDDRDLGYNPKVNNLANAMRQVSHEFLVISDSNVRVSLQYLRRLVAELMKPGMELVTSVVRGVGDSGLGSILENVHLNGFVAGSAYTVTRLLKIPVTIGKSMCFRRRLLTRLGGWEAFADYLFEDALMGREVSRLGHGVGQCFDAVENVNSGWSLGSFLSRHLRWATMRRYLSLTDYAAELFGNPIVLATMYLAVFPGLAGATVWGATVLAKIALDYSSARTIGERVAWYRYLIVPVKDLVMGVVWAVPFFLGTVSWRGNRFRLGRDTLITPAAEGGVVAAARRILTALSWRTSPREA